MRVPVQGAAALLTSLGMAFVAHAETAQNNTANWRFQVTPYVWGVGAHGKLHLGPESLPKIRFRQSLSDILDNLDGAFFITGTARRGPWMFGLDYSWSSQSASHKPLGLVTVKGRVRLSTGTLTGGYTVVNTRDATVDLAVGLRGWDISSQIDVPALGRGLRKKESWVDPVVGIRGRWQMTPSWSLSGYADAGRGVFGHGSRFTWQYMVAANYSFNDAWSTSVGYRRLGVDYNRNGVDLDLVMSGPLLGVTYRF